jgi:hypothetical protein
MNPTIVRRLAELADVHVDTAETCAHGGRVEPWARAALERAAAGLSVDLPEAPRSGARRKHAGFTKLGG